MLKHSRPLRHLCVEVVERWDIRVGTGLTPNQRTVQVQILCGRKLSPGHFKAGLEAHVRAATGEVRCLSLTGQRRTDARVHGGERTAVARLRCAARTASNWR